MKGRAPKNIVYFIHAVLLTIFFLGALVILLNSGSTIQQAILQHFLAPPPLLLSVNEASSQSNASAASETTAEVKLRQVYAKLSPRVQESIIAQLRRDLRREFKGYTFSGKGEALDHLILERGGQPIRSLILTAWESDADFVGSPIQAVRGMFYYSPPFGYLGTKQVRGESLARMHLQVLEDLLHCNYSATASKYIDFENSDFVLGQNRHVDQYCKDVGMKNENRICSNASFLSKVCQLFPFQAIQVTRMRLKLIKPLLNDPAMNVRVIYLVRDPRGTMQFRLEVLKCKDPQCVSPSLLCSDLKDDYATAERFRNEYPDRFMTIRLEDIALDPATAVKRMFKFLQLPHDPEIANSTGLVKRPDSGGAAGLADTQSLLTHMAFGWAKNLTKEQISDTQKYCRNAMVQWGYALMKPEYFNPLNAPPWTEMRIARRIM